MVTNLFYVGRQVHVHRGQCSP